MNMCRSLHPQITANINSYIKDIVKISWPIIIGQLGLVLTGFFDNLMVGQVGHEALASAGICNSVFFLITVFPLGITISFSTIVGLLVGKNHKLSIYIFTRDALKTTLVLSLLGFILLQVFAANFEVFKQTAEVNELSSSYLTLLNYSFPFMLFFFMLKHIADGYSYTMAGMIVTISALLINIFFNWVFIYGNLGFQAYGLDGAGYATIISRFYMLVVMAGILFSSPKVPINLKTLKTYWKRFKSHPFIGQIINIGIPTGLQYFFEVGAFVFAAVMAGWISSEALAAHQIAITLASLSYMFASGISAGASICVATSFGQKDLKRVKAYGKSSHLIIILLSVIFAFIFILFREDLARLFSDNTAVIDMSIVLLFIAGLFQLVDGLQAVSLGILRGMEDTTRPSIYVFISYWLISMPLTYLICFHVDLDWDYVSGINAIWLGLTFGLLLASISLTIRFYQLLRKHK